MLGDDAAVAVCIGELEVGYLPLAREQATRLRHLKPHGALYNDAARDPALAGAVVSVVELLGPEAALYGPPDSELARAARAAGRRFVPEGFVDRRYLGDGRLQPRGEPGAVIGKLAERESQALELARHGQARAADGSVVAIPAATLCLHGDSDDALRTAATVREALLAADFEIAAP